MERVDGRRARGDRSRRAIATRAAALATVHGLGGTTLSLVAKDLGVAKSSVQAAFATKEELQLAAIDAASETFVGAVVGPASAEPEGRLRLLALVDAFLAYVETRVFPGGCFMSATFAEFDSHPGPVRDALTRTRTRWLGLLERQIVIAQQAGDIDPTPDAATLAFEIDALLAAANVARNLHEDTATLEMARRLISLRTAPA